MYPLATVAEPGDGVVCGDGGAGIQQARLGGP